MFRSYVAHFSSLPIFAFDVSPETLLSEKNTRALVSWSQARNLINWNIIPKSSKRQDWITVTPHFYWNTLRNLQSWVCAENHLRISNKTQELCLRNFPYYVAYRSLLQNLILLHAQTSIFTIGAPVLCISDQHFINWIVLCKIHKINILFNSAVTYLHFVCPEILYKPGFKFNFCATKFYF